MQKYIVILEDETERASVMNQLLTESFPDYTISFFDNTPEMLDWLKVHLHSIHLICLDHDLGTDRTINGVMSDPGTGRDIANYLESQKPVCPVIIHTTNSFGRDAMRFALQDAGWDTTVVLPSAEISWIETSWLKVVKKYLMKKSVNDN